MNVLHPWALAIGAAGATLPVVIHLLTRPKPRQLPFSALRFVRAAVRQRAARSRLRDVLLLALRAVAVLLFGLAVARPISADLPAPTSEAEDERTARVIILDVSQSMAAQVSGVEAFERARASAAGYLNTGPGLDAGVVLAGAAARSVFGQLTGQVASLRRELAAARVRPERMDVAAAFRQAGSLLAGPGSQSGNQRWRREIIVVSDFQRSTWAGADLTLVPEGAEVEFVSVAPPEGHQNVGILRVLPPARVDQGREFRLEVEVGNFTPASRMIAVEVSLGDGLYRAARTVDAETVGVDGVEIPPQAAGWLSGEARLAGVPGASDALTADNVKPFAVEVKRPPVFGLVTRQGGRQPLTSSYFVERALMPVNARPGLAGPRVLRIDPGRGDLTDLGLSDVLILDHAGALPGPLTAAIIKQVRAGTGLLVIAADPQDAETIRGLTAAAGVDLRLPVEYQPSAHRRRDLFLLDTRADGPPFSVFGDAWQTLRTPLRFGGGLATRRSEHGTAEDLLATYSDRSACLAVTTCGVGIVAVLNADLGLSNLPSSPVFVPILGELMTRLLGRDSAPAAVGCSEPLTVRLPRFTDSTGIEMLGPGAPQESSRIVDDPGGPVWRSPGLAAPGVYELRRGGETLLSLAVSIPAEESDLRPLPPAVLLKRLHGGPRVRYRSAGAAPEESGQDVWWAWLVAGCVSVMLTELLVLRVSRS